MDQLNATACSREAFPLPTETRGDKPASGALQFRRIAASRQVDRQCLYHTANFAAFQLELAGGSELQLMG